MQNKTIKVFIAVANAGLKKSTEFVQLHLLIYTVPWAFNNRAIG